MKLKHLHLLCTLLFGVAVFLFFGMAYSHHLHFQEQFQLFLFDSNYVGEIVRQPGGLADLLGRFCTQFFLFAWVGALIIALLLSAIQLLTARLLTIPEQSSPTRSLSHLSPPTSHLFYGLTFIPSFLLWLFLLDENALLSGVWAVLLTLLVGSAVVPPAARRWLRYLLLIAAIPVLYFLVGPVCLPIPLDSLWHGIHYHRYPTVFPWLLWAAALSVFVLIIVKALLLPVRNHSSVKSGKKVSTPLPHREGLGVGLFLLVAVVMGFLVWKNANFKAERVMQYDFMARFQQWNRILETINDEKPNNQVGVTVQNLALAMNGVLLENLSNYNQNGIAGLLPDVNTDAISPLPTAEAFYQLGMINVAQRTVFEAQEAILDFQKSGRCYKRLAETNLINGNYAVARKYLSALQKTLFYREWANETLLLLGNEEAIARHPEYGRLRQWAYKEDLTSGRTSSRSAIPSELDGSRLTGDFYFSDHVTPEMLESLYYGNTDNRLAYQYLLAYYLLTGDRESFNNFVSKKP